MRLTPYISETLNPPTPGTEVTDIGHGEFNEDDWLKVETKRRSSHTIPLKLSTLGRRSSPLSEDCSSLGCASSANLATFKHISAPSNACLSLHLKDYDLQVKQPTSQSPTTILDKATSDLLLQGGNVLKQTANASNLL